MTGNLRHIFASSAIMGGSAKACIVAKQLEFDQITFADLVVTGDIVNYQIIKDAKARQDRKRMLENAPKLREIFQKHGNTGYLSDYASFEIEIDRVLFGNVTENPVTAVWDNSTFGEPKVYPSGPFVIALRRSHSPTPPLTGPSATILPNPEPNAWNVLQAPCTPPFIFQANDSIEAWALRTLGAISR